MSKQFVVGGAVRDVLLGRLPKDLDYVWVGATPEEMLAKGMNQVGADFPVFLDEDGNEHALARKERKVDAGYNGFEVDFDTTVTLEDDLMRRDLTINAMAVRADDWKEFLLTQNPDLVIDLFNGRSDLEWKILRHVSEAFAEDPVRVLRVARFAARYEFDVSILTLNLMRQLVDAGELDTLVPERVWAECEKALTEKNPMAFFRTLEMCGAAQKLFPEFELDGFMETCLNKNAGQFCYPQTMFAFACLALDFEQINTLCERLKVPTDYRKLALRSVGFTNILRTGLTPESLVKELEYMNAFQDSGNLKTVLYVAYHSAYNTPEFKQSLTDVEMAAPDVLRLRFTDLTDDQQQTLKGAEVGAALHELRLQTATNLL